MTDKDREEIKDAAYKALETEGFGYYMLEYGPDLDVLERLGYGKQAMSQAIDLFSRIQSSLEEYLEDE